MKKIICFLLFIGSFNYLHAQELPTASKIMVREHLLMDRNWHFAYGHPYDVDKDFKHATSYFSYITKTGYGDGPAAPGFNDGPWRLLDLPHDWAVEQPFAGNASHSHGYRTIGRNYPETSVGWYRKSFTIPESDLGKRISIQFDGVHRDAKVWVNGFYLGTESSGYSDFQYDISAYLKYGGENVVAVRVDVTLEEGWFYEGAGIYRHVWLNKTAPLHVAYNGTFVTSQLTGNDAVLTVNSEIENINQEKALFDLSQTVLNSKGETVATQLTKAIEIKANEKKDISEIIKVVSPTLWSLDNPYLYQLKTTIIQNGSVVDEYTTNFGIRTLQFDAEKGFFLNGKSVKIKGTCNHQDHAGVGTAMPDALQDFRISTLKKMGSNAYRCSHNPPTPELLDACDRLGMLVMVENRLMGTTPEHLDRVKRLMVRDRNHPSVIIWSLGNEEWAIEGNITGTRIGNEMQTYARQFDPSRPFTVAASGGWGHGVDIGLDVIGFNYLKHGNIDEHHKKFPTQVSIGSEESTTSSTRGIYEDNFAIGQMAPTDRVLDGSSTEYGWKFYDERPFLSGLFLWTGFDYRGEPNPLGYPAVSSQFGILDVCGFPKETYYYLQAWWGNEPVLKITPHWAGKEGDTIQVRVNSNCDEVELFLNDKSQGKKTMNKNSHLEWDVIYQPGVLLTKGYKNGKKIIEDKVETTGNTKNIELAADRNSIKANGEDISVITVQVNDAKGRFMPFANNEITFGISGPGKIIGVGNGDPASHEVDKFIETVTPVAIKNLRIATVEPTEEQSEVKENYDDSNWPLYVLNRNQMIFPPEKTVVARGEFTLTEFTDATKITLFSKSLAINQSIYINGHLIADNIEREAPNQVYVLDNKILKPGKNVYAIKGSPLFKRNQWEDLNTDPGLIQVITPEPVWKRTVFNGLAQIIVQSTTGVGEIKLTATSPGLTTKEIKIQTLESPVRPFVP
ncbi:MAG: beta-galactosidase GalA [Salinivirgaceae bacterium]